MTATITRAHDVADELFARHDGVFGSDAATYRGHVHSRFPCRGFRPMLVRAFLAGLRESPLRPMPMIKL